MSDFTITPPVASTYPALVTLAEDMRGQVDIMIHDVDGNDYRVAAIGNGKLHLFKINIVVAKKLGLQLNDGQYPIITLV